MSDADEPTGGCGAPSVAPLAPACSLVQGNERVATAGRCAATRWFPDVYVELGAKPWAPLPTKSAFVSSASRADVAGVSIRVDTGIGIGVGVSTGNAVGASDRRESVAVAALRSDTRRGGRRTTD